MPQIALVTLNARYAHASLGLRCLLANLPPTLRQECGLLEFTIKEPIQRICDTILQTNPSIVGLGVYIWNVAQTTEVVRSLKATRPELVIVLGGPEVSYELDDQEIVSLADHVITGEGEVSFAKLCTARLGGEVPPRVIPGIRPDVRTMELPYAHYTDTDLAQRVVYVEASRGCPYECEFCLSSLDTAVRDVPLDRFLAAMQVLLDRGVRQFKFIDRTFNLKIATSRRILEFFLDRYVPGLFVHFEMIPDRFPATLREVVARFPPGALQFEVGIQSFNAEVSARIRRRQDVAKLEENLTFLRANTGVHVHADLIVGLPGEDMTSFAAGFDRLTRLRPQEIQIGLLKRLRGTPIIRHQSEFEMMFARDAPYEIRATRDIDVTTMERLKRFARYWDLVHNSGNFRATCSRVLRMQASAFSAFLSLSDHLYERLARTHAISLPDLARELMAYLMTLGIPAQEAGETVLDDYLRGGPGRRVPAFLKPFHANVPRPPQPTLPLRQARHVQQR